MQIYGQEGHLSIKFNPTQLPPLNVSNNSNSSSNNNTQPESPSSPRNAKVSGVGVRVTGEGLGNKNIFLLSFLLNEVGVRAFC